MVENNFDFRCDICNEFMMFDRESVAKHYENKHKNAKSNWSKHTDIEQIYKNESVELGNAQIQKLDTTEKMMNDTDIAFVPRELIRRVASIASALDAKVYKFKTLANGKAKKMFVLGNKTLNVEYFITAEDRMRSARSIINKDVNLNHYLFSPSLNFVVDAEDIDGALVGLMFVEDGVFNTLYDAGKVNGVSVEYYSRHEVCTCDMACNCEHIGVVYVGIAIVAEPATPADRDSEITQYTFTKLDFEQNSERDISEVQSRIKSALRENIEVNAGEKREIQAAENSSEVSAALSTENNSEQNMTECNHNKEMAELRTSIAELSAKLASMPKQDMAQNATQETTAQTALTADSIKEIFESATKQIRADMLALNEKIEKIAAERNTGSGTNTVGFSREDLKTLLPNKIAMTSLAEIADLIENKE